MSHDPEKVIFSFSTHEVNDDEKLLLYKGLSFSISPKLLDYTDHMLPFELLFRDINKKELIKSMLKDSAFTLFWSYSCNSEINLTKTERLALNNRSNNKNIIIQKSVKDNSLKFFNLIMIRNSIIF